MCRLLVAILFLASTVQAASDPLPSWNDGSSKAAIISFVSFAVDHESGGFIPPVERIAVFDNDGTLWAEQPLYFQIFFAIDRVKSLAQADPEFANTPALRAAAEGDVAGVMEGGKAALMEVFAATHAGMTVAEYQSQVAAWLETARHPQTGLAYDDMIYQPMLEVLNYLRANDFEVFIVSGGGIDFMRVFTFDAYGVPRQNVIGSMGDASLQTVDGVPAIMKDPGIAFIDDNVTKPVAIARHIGHKPVFVGGNSDGDLAMAEWSTAGDGPRFAMFVRHTDDEREWAYDRDSHIGRLDKALDAAVENGWTVVDMEDDWVTIYPASE